MDRIKFPRIPHLPWSMGRSPDDIILNSISYLKSLNDIIVTEKLDGENTTLYFDYLHPRSTTYTPHPSRDWVKQLHSQICYKIPQSFRICGENLFARHSIKYNRLPGYFLVFAIFNENICLSWDETIQWCNKLGLMTVPVLYRGFYDEKKIKECYKGISVYNGEQEGYVVRNADSFTIEEFHQNIAKYVREGHVNTDDHWMYRPVEPNLLDNKK